MFDDRGELLLARIVFIAFEPFLGVSVVDLPETKRRRVRRVELYGDPCSKFYP